jgi:sec-independent protein translocase protein TatC
MFILKKIFQLREKAHPDHEKPFLEHLEDLRICVTRIAVTLLVAFIACFAMQEHLLKVMQRPVDRVWEMQVTRTLPTQDGEAPRPVDSETWEKAKSIERAAAALPDAERQAFFDALDDNEIAFHARMVALVRAVLALPEAERKGFIDTLALDAESGKQLAALVEKSPNPDIDVRGNLSRMSALRPTETFMLSMKLSFFASIVVSFPLLLMFILQFILPGLHSNEKRILWPSMAIGFGLFLSGVCFAYFIVLPLALDFFQDWGDKMGIANDWRIGEYITFATQFTLLFGLSFELPVVVMAMVKLGLLTFSTMTRTRAYAILAIFVAAAIITPTPDALTLGLMAGPMILLYEICIWLAYFDERKARRKEEEEAREREERRANLIASKPDGTSRDGGDSGDDDPPPATDLETHYEAGDSGWNEETPVDPHDSGWHTEVPEDPDDPYWYHETDDFKRDLEPPPEDRDKT